MRSPLEVMYDHDHSHISSSNAMMGPLRYKTHTEFKTKQTQRAVIGK